MNKNYLYGSIYIYMIIFNYYRWSKSVTREKDKNPI